MRAPGEGGGGGGGDRLGGEEDAGTRTPTDDWLQITRGTRGARGPALPSQILSAAVEPRFPARPPLALPPRDGSPAQPPAQGAVDYFLSLSEIIVWKGLERGRFRHSLAACGVCACMRVRVCV